MSNNIAKVIYFIFLSYFHFFLYLFFYLELQVRVSVTSYVTITTITHHDKNIIPITKLSHILQL